jgi:transposase
MFGLGAATRIYVATGATDMRRSFSGLHGLVAGRLKLDPLSGHLFLFANRHRDRLKILYFDGSGLWVCASSAYRKDHRLHSARVPLRQVRRDNEGDRLRRVRSARRQASRVLRHHDQA